MCVLFFVCPLLQLQPALCPQRSTLKTVAPGLFDSSLLWPMRVPAEAQSGQEERGTRESISQWLLLLPWPWAKAASTCLGSQLLSGGLFLTALDCLTLSPLPARPKYCSACPLLEPSFSLSVKHLFVKLFSYPLRCHLPPAGTQAMLLRMQW